jgi:biotin operon repressor
MWARVLRLSILLLLTSAAFTQNNDWSPVEKALARTGKTLPGGVIKFGMPRSDLDVRLRGVQLQAPFALGSWAAFSGDTNNAMLMGDLVLTEAELQPVIAKLEEGGIQISAIHNHVVGEVPRIMYVHIGGHGKGLELARSLHEALALTKTPTPSAPAAEMPKLPFDRAVIEEVMGATSTQAGEVLQFSIPRKESIEEGGMKVPPAMGTAIAINFQAAPNGQVATTGDFVLLADEVNKVVRALKLNGIEVTALHNHMLDEEPRLFFLHFWGVGPAAKIASAMKSGLEQTAATKP